MKLDRRILDRLFGKRRPQPERRLIVSNLTRKSVLAPRIEVAGVGAARRKGLLGRTGLSCEEGLWIVPCEAVHTFGMQFPIDLVYLDRHQTVKKVRSAVQPYRVSACLSAHSVLELASGTVQRTQTRPGDRLAFSSSDRSTEMIEAPRQGSKACL